MGPRLLCGRGAKPSPYGLAGGGKIGQGVSSWWRGVELDAEGTLRQVAPEECVGPFRKGGPFLTAPSMRAWGKRGLLRQHPLPALLEKSYPEIHLTPWESIFASFPMVETHKSSIIALLLWMGGIQSLGGGGYAHVVTLRAGGGRGR